MPLIWINDKVWDTYRKSWALMDVQNEATIRKFLEDDILQKSKIVIEDAETNLLGDNPEAYAKREIGLIKERQRKQISRIGDKTQ